MFTGPMPQVGGNTGFAIAYTIKMLGKNGLNVCLLPVNLIQEWSLTASFLGLFVGGKSIGNLRSRKNHRKSSGKRCLLKTVIKYKMQVYFTDKYKQLQGKTLF